MAATEGSTPARKPKLEFKEIEVECVKGTHSGGPIKRINLFLTIVRGPRGKKKILGEAFAREVYQPIVHFKVFDNNDVDALFHRFLSQLVHRGYRPLQYRKLDLDEIWGEWDGVDLSKLDLTDLERAADSTLAVDEDHYVES